MAKFIKSLNFLNQVRSTTSEVYTHTVDREPIHYYDEDDYDHVSGIYLYSTMRAGATDTAYIELYNLTDGASVTGSEILSTSTTTTLVTSGDISSNMTTAKDYLVRWKADDGAGGAPTNSSTFDKAVLDIKQDGDVTKTLTTIELGEDNNVPSTSYAAPAFYAVFGFESARFDGTTTAYLEAVLKPNSSSNVVYGALYDITAGAQVASSEVTHTGDTTKTRKRSGAITLIDGHEYRPDVKGDSTSDDLCSISVIIKQTGTPSKTDCFIPVLNGATAGTGSSYNYQVRYVDFDASDYDGNTKVFKYEATISSSSGNTAYYNLYNNTDAGQLAECTTTSTTPIRVRDDTVTMPTDDNNTLDSGRKIDTSGTVTVGRSFLVAQIDWSEAGATTNPSWGWGVNGW